MKSFRLLAGAVVLAFVATSCTTLSNRRDLYNPSEDTGPYNSLQEKKHPAPAANPPAPEELPATPQ